MYSLHIYWAFTRSTDTGNTKRIQIKPRQASHITLSQQDFVQIECESTCNVTGSQHNIGSWGMEERFTPSSERWPWRSDCLEKDLWDREIQ